MPLLNDLLSINSQTRNQQYSAMIKISQHIHYVFNTSEGRDYHSNGTRKYSPTAKSNLKNYFQNLYAGLVELETNQRLNNLGEANLISGYYRFIWIRLAKEYNVFDDLSPSDVEDRTERKEISIDLPEVTTKQETNQSSLLMLPKNKINIPTVESYGRQKYEISTFITPTLLAKYTFRAASNWCPMNDVRNEEEYDRNVSQIQIFNLADGKEITTIHCYKAQNIIAISDMKFMAITNYSSLTIWDTDIFKIQYEHNFKNTIISAEVFGDQLYVVTKGSNELFLEMLDLNDKSMSKVSINREAKEVHGGFFFERKYMIIHQDSSVKSYAIQNDSTSPVIKEHGILEGVFCYIDTSVDVMVAHNLGLIAIYDSANKRLSIWRFDENEKFIKTQQIPNVYLTADNFLLDGSLAFYIKNIIALDGDDYNIRRESSLEIFNPIDSTYKQLMTGAACEGIKSIKVMCDDNIGILRKEDNQNDVLEIIQQQYAQQIQLFWDSWLSQKLLESSSIPKDVITSVLTEYSQCPLTLFKKVGFHQTLHQADDKQENNTANIRSVSSPSNA